MLIALYFHHLLIDQVFLTLYRELYYRHIYAHLTPTLEQRFHSYENYCDLFNYILSKYQQPLFGHLGKGNAKCDRLELIHLLI